MRSRLKEFGWIAAAIGPLVLVWIVSHPRGLAFTPTPRRSPAIQRGPDPAENPSSSAQSREPRTLPAPVSLTGLTHPRAKLSIVSRSPGAAGPGHQPFAGGATADEEGGYRVEGLPSAVAFTVQVEAPGYRSRVFGPYQFPSGRHILDFELDTGLTLKGTVRDRAGRPVAGARVVFDDARTTTDADGSFSLSGLEERATTLVVSRDGYIQTAVPAVRPGSVEVTLPRAAEVSGRILGGRARFICFTVGDARYRMALGDSESFRIPSVPPGPLRLDIEDADHRLLGTVLIDAPEGGCVEGVEVHLR